MRRFEIVHKGESMGALDARSDYSALVALARTMGLDPASITGSYRLPLPGSFSPAYAVAVN